MPHSRLAVADRANQAAILPVLLIATSINEGSPSPAVDIAREETAVLKEGHNAIVQFTGSNGSSVFGTENAIKGLLSDFHFLKAKDEKAVCLLIFIRFFIYFKMTMNE